MACVVQPGNPGGFQKVFFGREEVAIPLQGSVPEAAKAYPGADVFINFASFRRCSHCSVSLSLCCCFGWAWLMHWGDDTVVLVIPSLRK